MNDFSRTEKVTENHADAKPATDTKTTENHADAKPAEAAKDSKVTETREG
jgi:hypothetical protein